MRGFEDPGPLHLRDFPGGTGMLDDPLVFIGGRDDLQGRRQNGLAFFAFGVLHDNLDRDPLDAAFPVEPVLDHGGRVFLRFPQEGGAAGDGGYESDPDRFLGKGFAGNKNK